LERYYNNLAGFDGKDDTLPQRFLKEKAEGEICELKEMLEEYYKVRGWQQGVVPQSKLKELGII
jgi:aldehyde:ferredoxin oxidoreductase